MADKKIKIRFIRDHSPRKEGEVFEAETHEEKRIAEWYLANQLAVRCGCSESEPGCMDCNDKKSGSEDDEPLKAPEAIEHIGKLETVEEIQEFVKDETRKSVLKASEERIAELTEVK